MGRGLAHLLRVGLTALLEQSATVLWKYCIDGGPSFVRHLGEGKVHMTPKTAFPA